MSEANGQEFKAEDLRATKKLAWWKWFAPLLIFIALLLLFYRGLDNHPGELPSQRIGKPVPAFALPNLFNGEQLISQQSLQTGQPYLLNVWATWCATCYVEHPYLLQLAKQGVRIIGVNYKDDGQKARDYLQRLGNPYEAVLVDSGRLGVDLGVYGAPETFLVSAQGEILHRRAGDMNETVWQSEFVPLLNGAR